MYLIPDLMKTLREPMDSLVDLEKSRLNLDESRRKEERKAQIERAKKFEKSNQEREAP